MRYNTIDTSTFKVMNKRLEVIKQQLKDYYRDSRDELNYEYTNGKKYELVFITNKNGLESTISRFYLPIHFKTVTGKEIIFVDLRSCVNIEKNKDFSKLSEIVSDKTLFDIKLTHVAIVSYYLEKESFTSDYLTDTLRIFTTVLSNLIVTNLTLDQLDGKSLRILIGYYYASIIYPDKNHDSKVILVAKTVLNVNDLSDVDNLLTGVNENMSNIDDLIDLIKTKMGNSRVSNITKEVIYIMFSNLLFGTEVKQYLLVSLEDPITFITLVENSYTNRIFKKTRLANILDLNKKYLDVKDYIKRTEIIKKIIL